MAVALVRFTYAFETFEISVFHFLLLMCDETQNSNSQCHEGSRCPHSEYVHRRFRMARKTLCRM